MIFTKMERNILVNTSLALSTEEIRMAVNHLDDKNYHLSVTKDDMDNIVINPWENPTDFYISYQEDLAPKTFADLLEIKGMSGYRLAKLSDVPQSAIASWVSGARDFLKCELSTGLKIAKSLGMTVEEIDKLLR